MKGKMGFMVCVCAMILFSVPATAVFEVPEGAVTFESLGVSGTYDADAIRCQTKEVTLRFAEPNEVQIFLSTYRRSHSFYARIYVEGILATESYISSGNDEVSIIIPGAFIKVGENAMRLEFIDSGENHKFSEYPLGIAPKSYIMSTDAPEIVSPTKTPVYSPTPSPTIPTSVTTTPIIPTSMPASSPDETLPSCEKGYKDCYPPWGDCETNIYEDNDNCGDCGNQCPEGYFCLLGSCVEDTTANKEKLAAYYMEQYQRYEEEKRYEDAKNYLLKAKDVYIDINRPGQVLEIDGLIEEIEEKIFERDIFELVFEIAIAVILAVFFGFIFARKTKKVSLWIVVTSSAMVFFIVFLVLRLWILPIFY